MALPVAVLLVVPSVALPAVLPVLLPAVPKAKRPVARAPNRGPGMLNFGTFLLMQSPSARPSQEIYARAVDMAQAAEALGFRNIWLAEHHFSTYGYLSRPAQLATYHRGEDHAAARGHRGHRRAPAPSAGRSPRRSPPSTCWPAGASTSGSGAATSTTNSSGSGLELDSARARWEESVDIILKAFGGEPFSYDGKLFKIPETSVFPAARCRSRTRRSG